MRDSGFCRVNPLSEFKYDGLSVHPYEVMFVPMSTVAIENGWSFAKLAAQYETWMSLQVGKTYRGFPCPSACECTP